MAKQEAWVTYAQNDEEARRALVLLKSLRRVCTNRQIVLVTSSTLSQVLWKSVQESFDVILSTPVFAGVGVQDFRIYAAIFSMSLSYYKKIVFLNPFTLVLDNCDDLFLTCGVMIGERDTGSIVIEPKISTYLALLSTFEKLDKLDKTDKSEILRKTLTTLNKVTELDPAYDFIVDTTTIQMNQAELLIADPKIIHFESVQPLLAKNGHLAPFYNTVWNLAQELSSQVDSFIQAETIPNPNSWKGCDNESIAIVGMSCKMPQSNNLDEFWNIFAQRQCAIRDPPAERWTKEQCVLEPRHKNVQAGFLSGPVDEFDSRFFGISPAELEFTDPQQRVLLEVAWQAIEDAGVNPHSLEGNQAGVFVGVWTQQYKEHLSDTVDDKKFSFRTYMGNSYGAMAARVAHFLGLTGPNISTESGCSSSSVAVGLGVKSLRNGEVNMALACGVNLLLFPFLTTDFAGLLSPENRSKVFDADANGFARAEGCGVLVLKRLSDAVKNGDRIHALIRGYGMSQEGTSRSMGTPTVDGEALAMQIALKNAQILPQDVQVLEAHGTGTAVGDPLEVLAITKVYSTPERKQPLIITAGKANIGHTEASSGIAGIIKTILEMKNQLIPPQILVENWNPAIDLAKIPAETVFSPKVWESTGPRIAGVNSFGITGTNTHIILQEASDISNVSEKFGILPSPSHNLLTLSAKSDEALEQLVLLYKKLLEENKDLSLDSVCYSANTGRAHLPHRLYLWGKNCQEVLDKLAKRSYDSCAVAAEDEQKPNICFLFTGQGSQFHGMGKVLYDTCPVFKVNFDKCENILKSLYGLELKDALWGADSTKLHKSLYSQSAIFVMEYCLVKLWESWGIVPRTVVGHSLGEFAAATTANILSLEDALKLLGARCRLIDGLPRGKMIAVKANEKRSLELISTFVKGHKGWLDIAAVNSPDQTTISGPEKVVLEFANFCEKNNTKSHVLDATHAFHSREMDAILQEYKRVAESITYNPPAIHFVSGVEGKVLNKIDADYWVRHTREAVQFTKATSACFMEGQSPPLFLEVGPHPVLSALVHANAPPTVQNIKCFPSIRKPPVKKTGDVVESIEWQTMLDTLGKLYVAGVPINFGQLHRFHIKTKVSLPFYPFQRKPYWKRSQKYNISKTLLNPLLGSKVNSPKTPDHDYFDSARQSRFENLLTLQTHGYIGDHKVGKFALLPGAGFLEVFAAAASTVAVQDFPITLENIVIKSPFVVEDVVPRELHTVLTLDQENPEIAKLTAFGREADSKSTAGWNVHSESVANLRVSSVQSVTEGLSIQQLNQIKERLCLSEPNGLDAYKQMAAQGYNFGKLFQSLGTTWSMEGQRLIQVSLPAELQDERDMCHPILIDAMVQALLLNSMEKVDGLYLPVGVSKFILLDTSFTRLPENATTADFFIHVKTPSTAEPLAVLYKSEGSPVAVMCGVQVVKTPLIALQKKLEAMGREHALPPLFQEEWRPSNAFCSAQFDRPFLQDAETHINAALDANPVHKKTDGIALKAMDEDVRNGCMLTLLKLGMSQRPIGQVVTLSDVMQECGIIQELEKPMQRYLEILAEDGYFVQSAEDPRKFKVSRKFPPVEEIKRLRETFGKEDAVTLDERSYHDFYIEKFADLISGKDQILTHLFPENENEETHSAYNIYTKLRITTRNYEALQVILPTLLEQCVQSKKGRDGKTAMLQILEIGAGIGSATRILLPILQEMDVKYSYTFTDISSAFFFKAKETFQPYLANMQFNVLNIEDDPKIHGLAPNQFDIVIAANVLHATHNLSDTSRNIRLLMKKFAVLVLVETFIPQRSSDLVFGLTPGYWRQTDLDLRARHCLIDGPTWSLVLHKAGFSEHSTVIPLNLGRTGIVLAQANDHIEPYILPSLAVTEKEGKAKQAPNTWILFDDTSDFSKTLTKRLNLHGKSVVSVHNGGRFKEHQNSFKLERNSKSDFSNFWNSMRNRSVLEDVEGLIFSWGVTASGPDECEKNSIFFIKSFLHFLQTVMENWTSILPKILLITRGIVFVQDQSPVSPAAATMLGMFRSFMNETRHGQSKFIDLAVDDNDTDLEVSQVVFELWSDYYQSMIAYRNGVRHLLKWTTCSTRLNMPYAPLDLNLSPTAKRFHLVHASTHSIGDLQFETHNTKQALQPYEIEIEVKAAALNFRDIFCVLKPTPEFENLNAIGSDLCGVVVAVGSHVTKRKVGDVVLGCNYNNAAMYSHVVMRETTCVSLPQRMTFAEGATLPTAFLTVYHCLVTVGRLRAGETILIHTASGGVGLCAVQIANFIGALIVATAGSKTKQAYLDFIGVKHIFNSRDLEFGKGIMKVTAGRGVDLVLNSLTGPEFKETSLGCCAKNARFVEMSKLNVWSEKEVKQLRSDVAYSIVDLSSMNDNKMALLFEQFGKHLNHPIHPLQPLPYHRFDLADCRSALVYLEKAKQIGKVVCIFPDSISKENSTPSVKLFNDRSTYLVTGGCGGIGFEVMKWMCENGAQTVVICGRNPPSAENIKSVTALNQGGKDVHVVLCDVGNFARCKEIISWIGEKLPPLRGIMHSAGCLSDAIISNQTMEKFETTLNPKVRGTWNLHKLTLTYPLEHFVLFSSMSSLLGSPGQSNHAGCNAFLDAFASYRRSLGLPACSINWGQWGEVGVAAGRELGIAFPMTTKEGLNALELSLRMNATSIIPVDCDHNLASKFFPWLKLVFELLFNQKESDKLDCISSEAFWRDLNEAEDDSQRYSVIGKYLVRILTRLLRIDEEIGPNQNFQDMGMDSLMMIELKNQLQNLLGPDIVLQAAEMSDCKTLYLTTEKLMDVIYSGNSESSIKRRNELIVQDSKLWDTIDITNATSPIAIENVQVVFMTGCTGTFGPYVLQQLSKFAQIKKIVCLVRARNIPAQKRLSDRLEYLDLLHKTDMDKVLVVEGDVTRDLLGLEQTLYDSLAAEIEAIIHCSVHTSHLEMYGRGASKLTGIKAVNVDGMQRMLEFASKIRVKHVYSASSLLGAFKKPEKIFEFESFSEWPKDGDADEAPSFGYGISKFIADGLVAEALKIGIPCKCFRFPKIVGEKDTGRQEVEDNHFFIKFIYFVKNGIMPNLDIPLQVVPVDCCAQISLSLFFNPAAPSDIFDVLSPHHRFEAELGELTPEYGPIFKIAEQLWKAADEMKEFYQTADPQSPEALAKFFQVLNKYALQEEIDLEPVMDLLMEVGNTQDILNNPGLLVKNKRVRAYLKENYGFPMRLVPYDEFVQYLVKDGERAALSKWIDFYNRDDSFYKMIELNSMSGHLQAYKDAPKEVLRKWCAKITQYLPEYSQIIPDGLEVVRMDFEYAIEHAVEKFRRVNPSVVDTLKKVQLKQESFN